MALISTYPWFGGKRKVAPLVWDHFGPDVGHYIEPFFGSGAVLLGRPQPFDGVETINDKDSMACNFWRALQADPKAVAKHAANPVNESDLHARHFWLVDHKEALTAKLEGDPAYFDAKAAGWWCWGMSVWIGSRFCDGTGPWRVVKKDGVRQLVHLSDAGRGVNRQLVHLSDAGRGVNRKLVHLGNAGMGDPGTGECGLLAWMEALAERLRRVRVCCGDWRRICGGRSGNALSHMVVFGPCAVFLDPPYSAEAGRDDSLYAAEDLNVAHDVRRWAIEHGDDPRLRIALAGYEGEHKMPRGWKCVAWKATGMQTTAKGHTAGKDNCHRERLWFSPACLRARQQNRRQLASA